MNDGNANTIQGIRTLHPFGGKGPIDTQGHQALVCLASPEGSRDIMRRDYYVVPPNRRA